MACKRSSVRIRYPPRLLDKAIALIRDGFFCVWGVWGLGCSLVRTQLLGKAITLIRGGFFALKEHPMGYREGH